MNEKAKKAERWLRKRLDRETRAYGLLPKVTNVKLSEITKSASPNGFVFEVEHEDRLRSYFYEVVVYAKSYGIWEV